MAGALEQTSSTSQTPGAQERLPARGVVGVAFAARLAYVAAMAVLDNPLVKPEVFHEDESEPKDTREPGYLVICWDDPVNLMDYVTHVFQQVFGWARQKAEFHMLQVHHQGKSVLTRESMERAEHYVHQLHRYGLHATMERDE
jgi:ATP-dependent Clp protease adaptor protein ClpS